VIDLIDCIENCSNLTVWHANEDEYALEAWERMTFAGVENEDGPGVYSIVDCDVTCTKERLVTR
jgi:hypothetical protein